MMGTGYAKNTMAHLLSLGGGAAKLKMIKNSKNGPKKFDRRFAPYDGTTINNTE
jgi:hypothetical protein